MAATVVKGNGGGRSARALNNEPMEE